MPGAGGGCGLWVFAALVAAALPARAADTWRPALEAAEDRTGRLTFAEVRHGALRFASLPGDTLRAGYSTSAWWLRFRVPAARAAAGPLTVQIGIPIVDRIEIHAVLPDGTVRMARAGDTVPAAQRAVDARLPLFVLPRAAGDVTVYARISGNSPIVAPVRVRSAVGQAEFAASMQVFVGLFFGVMLFALVYNGFLFLALRDAAYGWYVAYLAAAVALHAVLLGVGQRYVWDGGFALAAPIAVVAVIVTGAQYVLTFLAMPARQPRLATAIRAVQAAALLALVAAAVLPPVRVTPVVLGIGFLLMPLQAIAIVRAVLRRDPAARYLLTSVVFLLPAYAVSGLASVGVLPFDFLTENAMRLAAMSEAVIISFALADRINRLRRRQAAAERALAEERQRVAARLVASQEAERRRIAADLHDTVGQDLLVIGNRLKGLAAAPAPDPAAVAEIAAQTRATLDEVRTISQDLHPAALERLGPAAAIAGMARKLVDGSGIVLDCRVALPDGMLAPETAIQLYRALQGALANAVRHGGAARLTVVVEARLGMVEATVTDDGRGFVPAAAPGGLGLTVMAERMALVGGTLRVDSAPGRGTTIRLEVPADAPEKAAAR